MGKTPDQLQLAEEALKPIPSDTRGEPRSTGRRAAASKTIAGAKPGEKKNCLSGSDRINRVFHKLNPTCSATSTSANLVLAPPDREFSDP